MSDMLMELVGRRCVLRTQDEEYLGGDPNVLCRVTGLDGEWIRVSFTDDRGRALARLCRVDDLVDVTVFDT